MSCAYIRVLCRVTGVHPVCQNPFCQLSWSVLWQCAIEDFTHSPKLDKYVDTLVEVRQKKNVTLDMARDFLADPNYFGTVSTRAPLRLKLLVHDLDEIKLKLHASAE